MSKNIKVFSEEKVHLEKILDDYGTTLSEQDVFILPERINGLPSFDSMNKHSGHSPIEYSSENKELFNKHVPEIKKYFALNDLDIAIIRDKDKKVSYEVLNDNDFIIPIITFIAGVPFTIGVNILSNYISSKLFGSSRTVKADLIKWENGETKYKRYQISGSAEEVVEALKQLKDDVI